ncbi:MAG: murein biosynthesis integral membrane protein MurJ [Patescibacteria group bacterium]
MIRRLFQASSQSITSAAVIIGAAAFASRILGVLRDRILAGEFGAGTTLDIYYAAFRIPDFLYNLLILGALSAGFIPVFVQYWKKGERPAWELATGVLELVVASLAIIGALGWIFAPQLVPWITPGFGADQQDLTVALTRVMFLSPLLLGISAVWGGVLQSLKKFFVFSLAPIFYNIGIMIGALWFVDWWGPVGLAWGVVLGAGLHMLVQLPAVLAAGYRPMWLRPLGHAGVRQILWLMVPRTLGLAATQFNVIAMTVIASTLAVGSIAIFQLANNLQGVILGIFGVSFAIAAFPSLATAWADHRPGEFVRTFSVTVRQVLFLVVPLSVVFMVLRAQITRAVLGAGQFDWADTIAVADALALFAVSLFAQSLIPLLARAFFALHDTWTPFLIGLGGAAVNIALAVFLVNHAITIGTMNIGGVTGLAAAFSVASLLQMGLLWVALHFRVGGLDEGRIVFAALKISLAAVVLGIVVQALKFLIAPYTGTTTFVGVFSQGVIAGLGGCLAFVAASFVMRSEELLTIIASVRRRLLKKEAVVALEEEL